MTEIKVPKMGTRVEVMTCYSIPWMNQFRRPNVGIVSISNPWDKPGTFRLTQVDNCINESVIAIENVESIKVLGTSRDPENPDAAQDAQDVPEIKTFDVKGSGDKMYLVTISGDQGSCTCVAGSFGRECKHVKGIREQLSQQTR